jgi:hypothetical protein
MKHSARHKKIGSINYAVSRSFRRRALLLIGCVVAAVALSPLARAVDPPPVGGYPGENTALGEDALFSYDTSIQGENTACGHDSLYNLSTGIYNTAFGDDTLHDSTGGNNNTAVGWHAMTGNATGSMNTGIGCDALANTSTGDVNIAIGFRAGLNITTGSNNIEIGTLGVSGDTNTIRIGTRSIQRQTFIAGISGSVVPNGVGVIIAANGRLGTILSSQRYKEAVQPMDKSSEAILALQPVTFRYKKELDPAGIPQFGLVAEQVAKVKPDLVVRDDEGRPETVRYEAVNAMLLNEFLKEHRKVETQEKKVQQLETTVTRLEAALKEQAAQIQAVSEKVELGKPAPRMVTKD